jgi:murein DD-endopeptidase MepM/ murein hydrolase activator NlpD
MFLRFPSFSKQQKNRSSVADDTTTNTMALRVRVRGLRPPQYFLYHHAFSSSLYLGSFFLLIFVVGSINSSSSSSSPIITSMDDVPVPDLLSPFGSYPNLLNISQADRDSFHPVVIFPTVKVEEEVKDSENNQEQKQQSRRRVANLQVLDFTRAPLPGQRQLATEEEREERRNLYARGLDPQDSSSSSSFAVGRYDENRVGMYESDLFDDTTNDIDGFSGQRTVHMGMDLDAPVGTKVYAFSDATVLAAGYNPDLGDYGYVMVLEHVLPPQQEQVDTNKTEMEQPLRKIYALYGHLDESSIQGMTKGKIIRKGQLLGRMGDYHENGGWFMPHVHFQLSVHPPETHDMPGAVSLQDRMKGFLEYPDPRLILGPLY